jgi:hypothetical protein
MTEEKGIWEDFYATGAMTNRNWTETNYGI